MRVVSGGGVGTGGLLLVGGNGMEGSYSPQKERRCLVPPLWLLVPMKTRATVKTRSVKPLARLNGQGWQWCGVQGEIPGERLS